MPSLLIASTGFMKSRITAAKLLHSVEKSGNHCIRAKTRAWNSGPCRSEASGA